MRLISSEDFFLENTMILRQNLVFVRESQTIYWKIRIWANVTKFGQNFIAPKFFWAGTGMPLVTKSPQRQRARMSELSETKFKKIYSKNDSSTMLMVPKKSKILC